MEIYQHVLQQNLQATNRVINLANDIFDSGKTRHEQVTALQNCLERLQERGFTVTPKKCTFLKSSIIFFVQIFSTHGACPDPKRIEYELVK